MLLRITKSVACPLRCPTLLSKKLVQAPCLFQFHFLGHLLFGNGLERLGGSGSLPVMLHEIVHHVDESLIGVATRDVVRAHQRPEHRKDVRALRVSYALIGLSRLRRNQPQSQPQRTGIVRRNSKTVFLQDTDALPLPEVGVILLPLWSHGLLQKQSRGKLRKTFGEPLIMIRSPSDAVAKPLMRHLMRRHFLHESRESGIDLPEQHPTLRRIDVRRNRQVHHGGPRLAETEIRLFPDVDVVITTLPTIHPAHLHLTPPLIHPL